MRPVDPVCWVEEDYDRDRASDGISRYGAYLRDATRRFEPFIGESVAGITTDPVEFTIAAFTVATGPIMSPGYVWWHPRVHGHQVTRSEQDGRLLVSVTLVTPPPVRLRGPWWSWRHEFGRWVDPTDNQHAALTRLELRWPVPTEALLKPHPPARAGLPNLRDAKAAVRRVVSAINDTAEPVLAQLEANGPSDSQGWW